MKDLGLEPNSLIQAPIFTVPYLISPLLCSFAEQKSKFLHRFEFRISCYQIITIWAGLIVQRVGLFALHATDLGLIVGIPYESLYPPGVIPDFSASSNP